MQPLLLAHTQSSVQYLLTDGTKLVPLRNLQVLGNIRASDGGDRPKVQVLCTRDRGSVG
jgi:hypothetical protein